MLVSHRHKFIYLKTTNTGGTSVEMALQNLASPSNIEVKERLVEPIVSNDGIIGARGAGANTKDWFNHMPASAVREKISDEIWTEYFKFCVLRNPWEKTFSWFKLSQKPSKSLSIDQLKSEFRSRLLETRKIMRDFHIYSIKGIPVMDGYIRHSRLADDLSAVCDRLQVAIDDIPLLKKSEPLKIQDYHEFYDEETRAHVADIYAPEIELFGWTFEDRAPSNITDPCSPLESRKNLGMKA